MYVFQVTDQLMDSPIDEDDQSTDKQHPRGEEVPELTSGGLVTLQWIQLLLRDLNFVSYGHFANYDFGVF